MALADIISAVMESSAVLLELQDKDGALLASDPVLERAAYLAHTQVCGFLRRPIAKDDFVQIYRDVKDEFYLQVSPVDLTKPIVLKEFETESELSSDSFKVTKAGLVYFKVSPAIQFITGGGFTLEYPTLIVSYNGGYDTLAVGDPLFESLLIQTCSNYKRRDLLGISYVQGRDASFKVPSDRGAIVDSVKEILQSHVYMGSCSDA